MKGIQMFQSVVEEVVMRNTRHFTKGPLNKPERSLQPALGSPQAWKLLAAAVSKKLESIMYLVLAPSKKPRHTESIANVKP